MNLTHDKGKSTRKSRTSAGLLTCEETLVATTQGLKIKKTPQEVLAARVNLDEYNSIFSK